MVEREEPSKVLPIAHAPAAARLPYVIELWNLTRDTPEKVIARAASALLARAIFSAAQGEHLGRMIVLRRGSHVLARTD